MKSEYHTSEAIVAGYLKKAGRITILTGAGVSAESGVPTFRASDGLWEGHRIEDVASPEGFRRDPKLVWEFYNGRRVNVAKVQSNAGHYALARLEEQFGDNFSLITQNVDGLHQRAGSKRVLELHGNLSRTRCLGCGEIADRGLVDLGSEPTCENCGGRIRPDIVWFGEMLPTTIWSDAQRAVKNCDVLMVVGTSAVVYPAAGLIAMAKNRESRQSSVAKVIEINLIPTDASSLADVSLFGPSGEILPRIVELVQQ